MTRKQNDRASRVEIVAIHKRLAETVTKLDGGMCVYQDGVSDQTIAQELGVSRSSVAGLRQEMFGKVRAPASAPSQDPRIDDLLKVNENVLKAYTDLRDRHNKLIALLALNRVVDCKHLAVS
jgi:hypothetical protein